MTNALAEKRKSGAPYLDSKVSRLLQEAIGGKARTCVIATFSPAKQQLSSSSATAQMSQSFRAVENQPSMSNKELQKKTIALNEYLNELEGLKAQLAAAREKNGVYLEPAALNTMQSQIAKQEKEIADAQLALQSHQETIQSLTSDKAQLLLELSASKNEIADANKVIADLQQQLKAKSTAYDTIFEDNISMKATLQAVQNTVKQQAADLEEAKADKKLLQDQLELHTVQHEKTATTLKQTEFALKQAEADLARNTVEVKAAEAVIAEQSATEKTLLGHGSELQSDLIARQDDVKALHGKVDRFAAKEQERLNETTKFVATTNDKNNALTSEIAIIASSHADKTKILTDGYSSVLTAGRTACQEVKASLEIALVVLLSQSDASRHAIGQSSDQTKRHLQDFDSNMAKALKAMRDKIASWLSESEQHLSKAQKDLDEQKRQVCSVSH